MKAKEAYDNWSVTYDHIENKTRDLEKIALKSILNNNHYNHILELGCGTGKNTGYLSEISDLLTAVDFSENMLNEAIRKTTSKNVTFQQADIMHSWNFKQADLITCSLILEHIKDISFVFQEAARLLNPGGTFYITELHPYKQLEGSKAKFESDGNTIYVESYIHHISDYFDSSHKNGFTCIYFQEWFDENDRTKTPRLCSMLFKKGT